MGLPRRYGYLQLAAVLRREGLVVNRKRTYRLYTGVGLQVRTRMGRKPPRRDRIAPQVPERPMQRWSLDFIGDQLVDYRRFRMLDIVDDHSRWFRSFADAREEISRWRHHSIPTGSMRRLAIAVRWSSYRQPPRQRRDSCDLGAAAQCSTPAGEFQ